MCCCFLPQMFSFVFNGQKSQACLAQPTDRSVLYLEPQGCLEITEAQMLSSPTNEKVSQHRPMEFDTGPSISYRNKTTTIYLLSSLGCMYI